MGESTSAMTKGEEQAATLREAAALVTAVCASLQTATERCQCCGRLQPVDKVEHQAEEALTQLRVKLENWADTLARPRDQREDSPGAKRNAALARRHRG